MSSKKDKIHPTEPTAENKAGGSPGTGDKPGT